MHQSGGYLKVFKWIFEFEQVKGVLESLKVWPFLKGMRGWGGEHYVEENIAKGATDPDGGRWKKERQFQLSSLFQRWAKRHHRSIDTTLKSHFWELEVDFLSCELFVDRAEGLSLVLNVGLLSLVQVNFEEASSIQTDPKIGELKILAVEWLW